MLSDVLASPTPEPRITRVHPIAALPGGEIHVHGSALQPVAGRLPVAMLGELAAGVLLSREDRLVLRIPDEGESALLRVLRNGAQSNSVPIDVAQLLTAGVHQVSNPAVDAEGNVYGTFSGQRGQETPVSVFKVSPAGEMTPFVTGIVNATGLAMGADGYLYVSSRNDGTIYRVSPDGAVSTFSEGMGVATGIAFDAAGNLYVGDRSGTIFKIAPDRQIFVFATLEPSIAAYHLAFGMDGTLFVAGPTTSSYDTLYAIGADGTPSVHYRGLGRPQGLMLDIAGNVYVGASLSGRRGIVQISLDGTAELVASGAGIAGMAFIPGGDAVIATANALFTLPLGVEGLRLV
ncbi:gluconolaconase [Acidipila sp. EB88]|uniref:gluconolaconase n=1 Tax=Acidipila sp. EB88 TaxID=2305226 RepID=UPI000F5FA9A1|nr:gluconolaconase [Acidipila sp. EB88]RRA48836.1 gluconolaconase [Acidipila sp. EB88]